MDGIGGKAGWSWIFILEGLTTVVAGFVSYWIIQDFPNDAKFLTEEERAFVLNRLKNDNQFTIAGETLKWRYVWLSVTDWKTWVGMGAFMGIGGALYAFSLFLPTILSTLGYSPTPANLLSVPVYTVASIFTIAVGYWADRIQSRGWFNIISLTIGAIGYIILIASRNAKLSYFATYLSAL